MIEKIYLDMDGVLADFDSHFTYLYGESPKLFEERRGQVEFWRTVYKTPRFFSMMPALPHAQYLRRLCEQVTTDLCILSSPSRTNQSLCVLQKRIWVDREFGEGFPAIFEASKHIYAEPGALLIDDTKSKVDKWIAAGGEAILFDKPQDCFNELTKLIED